VLRGQIDSSARAIRWFELAGWATDVRWPSPERIESRRQENSRDEREDKQPVKEAA